MTIDKWEYILKLDRPPTTDEMDGLITDEDKANKYKIMLQCASCNKWTKQDIEDRSKPYKPCHNCEAIAYDITSGKSLRTYNPLTDSKRKPKVKK